MYVISNSICIILWNFQRYCSWKLKFIQGNITKKLQVQRCTQANFPILTFFFSLRDFIFKKTSFGKLYLKNHTNSLQVFCWWWVSTPRVSPPASRLSTAHRGSCSRSLPRGRCPSWGDLAKGWAMIIIIILFRKNTLKFNLYNLH